MSYDLKCFIGMLEGLAMIGVGLFLFWVVGQIFKYQAKKAQEYHEIRRLQLEEYQKQSEICHKVAHDYQVGNFRLDWEEELRYIEAGGDGMAFLRKSLQNEARRRLWADGHIPNDYLLANMPFCNGHLEEE